VLIKLARYARQETENMNATEMAFEKEDECVAIGLQTLWGLSPCK
jgi:hypothetical protein